jgi:hypothetical protein
MNRLAVLLCALPLTACADSASSGLGIYQVTASQTTSCATEGLLAAPNEMLLSAHLRRVGTSLHWDDGRGLLIGPYDEDDSSFVVEQSILVDMREDPESDLPSCKIWRFLTIDAALTGASPQDLDTVEGEMSYAYDPTVGSSCDDLLSGPTPLAKELPCTATFELSGERQ